MQPVIAPRCHPLHDLPVHPVGAKDPTLVNALIEIPAGSKVKYEIDKDTGMLFVDRVLYSSTVYPHDYGFIPQTLCDDGDALVSLFQPFVCARAVFFLHASRAMCATMLVADCLAAL